MTKKRVVPKQNYTLGNATKFDDFLKVHFSDFNNIMRSLPI